MWTVAHCSTRLASRSLRCPGGVIPGPEPTGCSIGKTEPSTGIPAILERGERWFPGQLAPQHPGQRIAIRLDALRGQLEHQGADGAWSAVGDAAGALPAGSYVLTLRFSTDGRPMFFVPIAVVALDGERPHDRVFVLGGT